MFVSWRWISQWVDTSGVDALRFADRFTCTVAEIDKVIEVGQGLDAVLVADVVAVTPHPNADKLRLATVDLGDRQVTVVCGAPDLAVGMRVPFVPPGVTLPSGITVREGEVRGVPSPGMLASEADLGLSEDHGGLMTLDGCLAPAGTSLIAAVEVTDVLYDVDNKAITHRPDLWGQYGMAREVAAMLGKPLAAMALDVALGQGAPVALQVASDAHCPRYVCARVEGVQIAPSPVDLRLRLRRCGVRPISNVVDATNLVMLETGNPLHAFDARSLRGQAIHVRLALPGETIQTLDGAQRLLQATDCVIADAVGAVALAGIMGGADSEIRDDTQTVVLEAAAFDAPAIRKTALRLGMRTESSARFEKGLDPMLPHIAARRFLRLVLAMCPDARVVSGLVDAGPYHETAHPPVVIRTTGTYLRQRLGVSPEELTDVWLDHTLHALHFAVDRAGDGMAVTVPTFRSSRDVRIAEDLVEELGRHHGYQRIRSQPPLIPARPPYTPPLRALERTARTVLVHGARLTEVLTYGFDHETERARLALHEDGLPRLKVCNTIASDLDSLRRNLAPNLITAVERNLQTGDGHDVPREGLTVGLFEIGRAFVPVPDRPLTAAEVRAIDVGLPDVLRADPASDVLRDYLSHMDPEARLGALEARDRATVLPWQPMRLCIVIAERLGGGAEGMKASQPSPEVTQRVFGNVVHAIQSVLQATDFGPADVRKINDLAWPQSDELAVALPDLQASWLHPQRHGIITVQGRAVGIVSALHPVVRQALSVAAEVVIAELNLDALLGLTPVPVRGKAPSQFPVTAFDVTVPLPVAHKAASARNVLWRETESLGVIVESVDCLYAYTSADAPDVRALTFRIVCRASHGTLTSQQVTAVTDQARGKFIDASFWQRSTSESP